MSKLACCLLMLASVVTATTIKSKADIKSEDALKDCYSVVDNSGEAEDRSQILVIFQFSW